MNLVILKGNLTRDPEIKVLNLGGKEVTVVNFSLAVSRFFKKADGTKDHDTTFISCELWDSGAKTFEQYCHKGDPVLLTGSLKSENWEVDGKKMSRLKVRVSNFEKLYRATPREDSETTTPENNY